MKQHTYILYAMHHVGFVCFCANFWLDCNLLRCEILPTDVLSVCIRHVRLSLCVCVCVCVSSVIIVDELMREPCTLTCWVRVSDVSVCVCVSLQRRWRRLGAWRQTRCWKPSTKWDINIAQRLSVMSWSATCAHCRSPTPPATSGRVYVSDVSVRLCVCELQKTSPETT